MASAPACVDMCQPSATTAIEPNIVPPTISATIMTAVSATTNQVRRSCAVVLGAEEDVGVLPGLDRMVCMDDSCEWRSVKR